MANAIEGRRGNTIDEIVKGVIIYPVSYTWLLLRSVKSMVLLRLTRRSMRDRVSYTYNASFQISSHALIVIASLQVWYCTRLLGYGVGVSNISALDSGLLLHALIGTSVSAIIYEFFCTIVTSIHIVGLNRNPVSKRRQSQRADILRYMIGTTIAVPSALIILLLQFNIPGDSIYYPIAREFIINVVRVAFLLFFVTWTMSAPALTQLNVSKFEYLGLRIGTRIALSSIAIGGIFVFFGVLNAQTEILSEMFPDASDRVDFLHASCAVSKDGHPAVKMALYNRIDKALIANISNADFSFGDQRNLQATYRGYRADVSPQALAGIFVVLPPKQVSEIEFDVTDDKREDLEKIPAGNLSCGEATDVPVFLTVEEFIEQRRAQHS
jgi:hypothetical protein